MAATFNGIISRKFTDDEVFIVSKENDQNVLHPDKKSKKTAAYIVKVGYEGAAIFTKSNARRLINLTSNSGRLTWLAVNKALKIQ